jgi:hypothetical protein
MEDSPPFDKYFPATQALQVDCAVTRYFPAPHSEQITAPSPVLYFPAGQSRQRYLPERSLYFPISQSKHAVIPVRVLYLPVGQKRQVVAPIGADAYIHQVHFSQLLH